MSSEERTRRMLLRGVAIPLGAAALAVAGVAWAACLPTAYTVTSSAPPPTANWTDTSGAVWSPAGGFPGCAVGDSAANTNASPTTLVVNSSIPNPLLALNLACAGCVIDVQAGGSLTLAGPGNVGAGATVTVEAGGTLTIDPAGALTVQPGGSVAPVAGALHLNGTVTASSVTVGSGGKLDGSGTLTGDLSNDGTVSPGQSPGTLSVNGNYTQGAGGALWMEIAGASAGQYDLLAIGGAATLDGALTLSFLGGYVPTVGTSWDVVTFASRTGDWAMKTLPPVTTGSYTPTAFQVLTTTPVSLQGVAAE